MSSGLVNKEVFEKELAKLQRLNHQSGEFSVQFNYLQNFLELPWNEKSVDNFDLDNARLVLDKDHFGMEKVKERILEHLAVLKLKGDLKSPILCLYGAPGVGKTSFFFYIVFSFVRIVVILCGICSCIAPCMALLVIIFF